jgi:hypothetical protein
LSPLTVNTAAGSVGRAEAVVAVGVIGPVGAVPAVGVFEAVGVEGMDVVIDAGPVAGGVAEHEVDSAAIAHAATTTTVRATGVI